MRTVSIRLLILTILAGITGCIWYWSIASAAGVFTVAFLDVEQGDSIYVEAPNGNQLLIDGGRDTKVLQRLAEVMPFGDRSIDVVIGTHPDEDHIGGLIDVLERYQVSYVIEPGMANDTGAWQSFLNDANEKGKNHLIARSGMQVDLGSGVTLSILYPDKQIVGGDTNLSSIVAKLTYGDIDFMLTGDAPQSVEALLVKKDRNILESEVLKAGHHGSKTSSAPQFLDAVHPLYAIISAGKDNRYGHPHAQTITALQSRDIEILETAKEGTIMFHSDGRTLRLEP